MIIKLAKGIIFAVGAYYVVKFILYVASSSARRKEKKKKDEATITHVPKKNDGNVNPDAGDYIEYEEVDD